MRERLKSIMRGFGGAALRDNDLAIMALAGALGIVAGLGVVLLRSGVAAFHTLMFQVPLGVHLSDGFQFEWWRVLAIPSLGGLVIGFTALLIRRWRANEIVDAIEANALYGGRMSITDSLNLAALTLLSGGVGASVGLEAAYTQLGAGLSSLAGRVLRLRRDDVRMLVGCGAAAAIAAAFNAPLTGAFYAFELIIGSYTLAMLAPVTIAAIAGTFTARITFGAQPVFSVERPVHLALHDYLLFFLVGLAAAGLGILTMRGVTATEGWFRRRAIPRPLRPALGGLLVGVIALIYPQVLGSGHGGIVSNLHFDFPLPFMAGLIAAKIAGSAVSIGSGFRGGLFSSSLFIGSLFGASVAILLDRIAPALNTDPIAYTLVGMGALGAAIVGAPVAMILLILETTGDFSATIGVIVGVLTASVAVRHGFGYSFATWRFHLRGLKIRSAEDIGWLDELTVASLMRSDLKTAPIEMSLADLRAAFPLGTARAVMALDDERFAGLLDLAELHSADQPGDPQTVQIGTLVRDPDLYLLPGDNIRVALARFSSAKVEILAVVDAPSTRRVIGWLNEAFALRRYTQALESRRGGGVSD